MELYIDVGAFQAQARETAKKLRCAAPAEYVCRWVRVDTLNAAAALLEQAAELLGEQVAEA